MHTAQVDLKILNGASDSQAVSDVWSKGQARAALGGAIQIDITTPVAATVSVRPSYASGALVSLINPAGTATTLAIGTNQLPLPSAFEDLRVTATAPVVGDQTVTVTMLVH